MPVLPEPSASAPAAGTVADLVAEVYTHLEATSMGVLNRLTDDITTLDGDEFTFDFDNQKAIRPGARLCIDTEVLYVWLYDEATRTATVQRGMSGSQAAEHAAGALVQVEPRASQFDVLTQIVHDINSWPAALFRVDTKTISAGATSRGYDLADTDDITRILKVWRTGTNADNVPTPVTGWRLDRNASTATYPSGKAIVFPSAFNTGDALVVEYALPFLTDDITLDTLLADIGLTASMKEIPVYGAAARLVREAPRTDTRAQGQSRLAEEVPPGHLMNTSASLWKKRDDRIHTEIARLRELYPQRRA